MRLLTSRLSPDCLGLLIPCGYHTCFRLVHPGLGIQCMGWFQSMELILQQGASWVAWFTFLMLLQGQTQSSGGVLFWSTQEQWSSVQSLAEMAFESSLSYDHTHPSLTHTSISLHVWHPRHLSVNTITQTQGSDTANCGDGQEAGY